MSVFINVWGPNQELIIKYSGLMDMNSLYKKIISFFKKRGFETHESSFKDKNYATGKEEEIKVGAFRNDTEMWRTWFNIYIHTWNMVPVEVAVDGKKKTVDKGRFKITIRMQFEVDYESKFEKSKFFMALRDFYLKYIIFHKLNAYGDKVEYEGHKLQEMIKQELGMKAAGDQFADMY
ncbi:MAG: hypothetical protein ABIH34_02325 [Nanoarchaeota archaeon]